MRVLNTLQGDGVTNSAAHYVQFDPSIANILSATDVQHAIDLLAGGGATGGAAAGSDTWIQVNVGGVFGAFANLAYDYNQSSFGGGDNSLPTGSSSIAWGSVVDVSGSFSAGFGSLVTVSGDTSFGSGLGTVVSGTYSAGFGANCIVASSYSFASGSSTGVMADYGFAAGGSLNLCVGNNAFVTGSQCVADTYGHAEGSRCSAGFPIQACTISGTTVTLNGGTDYSAIFNPASTAYLTGLNSSGGNPHIAAVALVSATYAGGHTVITLGSPIAGSPSVGYVTIGDGYVAYASAGGLNAFADLNTKWARSDGGFAIQGDGQYSTVSLSGVSSSGTPVILLIGGSARLSVRSNFTYGFTARVTGRKTTGTKHARFTCSGIISNEAGTTALVGAVSVVADDGSEGTWSVAVTADDTNDALQIAVTGEATVRWLARVELEEVGS